MAAQSASQIVRIGGEAGEQFASVGRRDDRFSAHDPAARYSGIERDQQVDALARVSVHRGEDRWVVVDTQEMLIEDDLGCVLRVGLVEFRHGRASASLWR